MSTSTHHLAQLNIGRVVAPLDSDQLSGFVAALEPINALADAAPGFVWRLVGDDGDGGTANNATSARFFGETDLLVNMSVWRDLVSLREFVFRSPHVEVMRNRRSWFFPMPEIYTALWWVPIGITPTIADAEQRLLHLREHGPTEFVFTFREPFPAPDEVTMPPASAHEAQPGSRAVSEPTHQAP